MKEVNLGPDEEPRPTYLSVVLVVDEESAYVELILSYSRSSHMSFLGVYKEMHCLDPKVAVYHLVGKMVLALLSRLKVALG